MSDYTALINVETNNMVVYPSTGTGVKDYVIELGDERGVNIKIASSTFSNSRFCKGMLVFKKRYSGLESTSAMTFTSLNKLVTAPTTTDTSLIEITDTTFSNLNHGRVIDTISLVNNKLYPITGITSAQYPVFDNHGAAINLQGYPGGVDISNSTFV